MSDYSKINDAYAEHCRSQGLPTYMDLLTKLDEAERKLTSEKATSDRLRVAWREDVTLARSQRDDAEKRERTLIAGVREVVDKLQNPLVNNRMVEESAAILSRLLTSPSPTEVSETDA